jgi:hypothetical protein
MFGFVLGAFKQPWERSIVESRGIPPDLSSVAMEEYAQARASEERTMAREKERAARDPSEAYHEYSIRPSWVTWKEIETFDWEQVDTLLFERDAEGRPLDPRPVLFHPAIEAATGVTLDDVLEGRYRWQEGQEWIIGHRVLRTEKIRRGDSRISDWNLLFDMMQLLAGRHGDQNVRLVAWFEY